MSSISITPFIPLSVIIILLVFTIVISFVSYRLNAKGSIVKMLTIFSLIFCLLNPKIITENKIDIPDTVALIIDLSPSQEINKRNFIAEDVAKIIKEKLNKFENLELRIKTIEDKKGTKVFKALSSLLGDVPRNRIAGAIVITDGQIHDVPNKLDNYNFKSPIHFLITGNKNEKDRRILIEEAPRFGIVGEEVSVYIKVEDSSSNSPNALVSVNINGEESKTQSIPIGEKVKLTLPLEQPGITNLNISVEEGPEELTLKNNSSQVSINAIRERLRVMLVSGEPNMGLRSWRNLLNSDPSVDLMHFTILRPPKKQDLTPVGELSLIPFPTRELFQLNLKEFDLIIFDQYHLRGILPTNYLKNIVEYVVKGGALLDATGPQYAGNFSLAYTPLQNILPTEPTGEILNQKFIPEYTEEGLRHPVTAELNNIEDYGEKWGPWYRMVESVALNGNVLLQGPDDRPLLVLNRIGKGRVAQILSDQSWVWTKSENGKGPQAAMLRRLIHWLMKEPELEEDDLIATISNNIIHITRNSLTMNEDPVEILSPSGLISKINLEDAGRGKETGKFTAVEEGIWSLSSGKNSINIMVGLENYEEYIDVRATDLIVQNIAEETNGNIFWIEKSGDIKSPDIVFKKKSGANKDKDTLQLIKNEQYFIKGIEQISLVNWFIVLFFSISSLFFAWYRESK